MSDGWSVVPDDQRATFLPALAAELWRWRGTPGVDIRAETVVAGLMEVNSMLYDPPLRDAEVVAMAMPPGSGNGSLVIGEGHGGPWASLAERQREIQGFFELLFGPRPGGSIVVSTKTGGKFHSRWFGPGKGVRPAAEFAARAAWEGSSPEDAGGTDVYFAVCALDPKSSRRRSGGRGVVADARIMPGCWVDLDIAGPGHRSEALPPDREAALGLLEVFGLTPTVVVDSGHGLQAWWLFDEPMPFGDRRAQNGGHVLVDALQSMIRAIAGEYGWSVDATADLARVLRPPGTFNWKVGGEPPCPVRIHSRSGIRYRVDELKAHLLQLAKRYPPPPRSGARIAKRGVWVGEGAGTEAAVRLLYWWCDQIRDALSGESNATFHRAAFALAGLAAAGELDALVTEEELMAAAEARGVGDISAVFRSAWAAGSERPWVPDEPEFEFAEEDEDDGGIATEPPVEVVGNHVDDGEVAEMDAAAMHLPDEFWEARPALRHIRQAAHSRQRSADAVLHAVLARVAAGSFHGLLLPAIVGSPVPLCYFAAVLAAPGVGKSSASDIAEELVPLGPEVADRLPIGSGEGLVEALFDVIEEPDPNNPKKTIRRKVQTRHNAYVYGDEGQVLTKVGDRPGAVLPATMRTIWTGGVLGQSNASMERRRIVPAGGYVYGVVIGMQPANAGGLLEDATSGTPQRFAWALASDPKVPDNPPEWPGPLELTDPDTFRPPPPSDEEGWVLGAQPGQGPAVFLDVAEAVKRKIRAADLARVRSGSVGEPLESHGDLLQLKAAALLALLDGRAAVGEEDWRLAGVARDVSGSVRSWLVARVEAEVVKAEEQTTARYARRAVASSAAVEMRRTVDGARKIAQKVWVEPERWTRGNLRTALRHYRAVFDDALEHAMAERWVVERSIPGQGEPKRVLQPGDQRPG